MLGVNDEGHLNVPGPPSSGGTPFVGLRYVPTNAESTAPGCLCEGFGAADATTGTSGFANVAVDGVQHLNLVSFVFTASTAISIVDVVDSVGNPVLRVTQDYHPSPATPNLYEVTVTIQNSSGAPIDPRYRRVMDWDVEPTPFSEFVTIDPGTATELIFDSNDGFATANPLGAQSDRGFTGAFVDAGPFDHGALFDFDFDPLAPGESRTFNIYYGAAGTELEANAALAAVGAEVFSYGQPNVLGGPDLGTPNTFIFAFAGVGGAPVFPDAAIEKTADDPSITAGETAAFTITTSNPSTDPVSNVMVTDTLPAGIDWSEDSADCAVTGGELECSYTTLGPGELRVVHLTGVTDAADCGTLSNTATVTAENDTNPANNSSTATIEVVCAPDVPTCNGLPATIVGSVGDSTVVGTPGNDVIVDLSGDNKVRARGGHDTICTGPGDDEISGGGGNDWVDAGDGRNSVEGNDGRDTLTTGSGDDDLEGNDGSDTMTGGTGADRFRGGGGTDTATDFTPAEGDTKRSVEIA